MADTHRIRWTTLGLTLGLLGSSPGALAHTLSAGSRWPSSVRPNGDVRA